LLERCTSILNNNYTFDNGTDIDSLMYCDIDYFNHLTLLTVSDAHDIGLQK